MMDSFFTMLRLQTILLLYMLVGIYISKRNIVVKEARPYFNEFLVRIALPFMIFSSFRADSTAHLFSASRALLASALVCGFSLILGKVLFRKAEASRRPVMQYATLVSNAGFAGLPQIAGSYGAEGLLYANIYLIPLRIFMWSGGISLFLHTDSKTKIKQILTNPGMIAVFLGVPCMLLRVSLPGAMDSAIQAIGDCTTPLSMIVIGMMVADISWETVISRDVLRLTFVRLLLIPLLVLAAMKAVGADTMLTGVCVVLTAMPVGANTPLLAQRYRADHEFATKAVLFSTVMSLFTLPAISLLL